MFGEWRAQGITDLREFLSEDLQHVRQCVEKIRILDVNQATLTLFEARDLAHLIAHLPDIFRDEMYNLQIDGLVAVWNGELQFASEQVNYSITGKRIDIQLRGQILPDAEHDLSRILVTTEDITAYQNARRQEFKNLKIVLWQKGDLSIHQQPCGLRTSVKSNISWIIYEK